MNEDKIVSALLTIALSSSQPQGSLDDIMQRYEKFLDALKQKRFNEVPSALKPMVDEVIRRRDKRAEDKEQR
jgi:hypothetical protein